MKEVFEVEISRPGGLGAAAAELPAPAWELRDALDMARITDERVLYSTEILSCKLPYLAKFIPENANLYELNHLARRLCMLEGWQFDCFEGMVLMDAEKGAADIPVERLVNFTHSMADCQFAPRVYGDEALGKFYVENDFPVIPENLPEILYEILDYESIGRKARMAENGVFTSGGYVVQNGEIAQAYRAGDAVPLEKPDYTILLDVALGGWDDPATDNLPTPLKLPADNAALRRAVRETGAVSSEECSFTAADCAVPLLMELINDDLRESDGGCYGAVNTLAEQLQRLDAGGRLPVFKAMLEAAPDDLTLDEAIGLAGQSADFALSREASDPADYARAALEKCEIPLRDELLRGANLHRYGAKLMEQDMAVSTDYGLLRPLDGRTVEQCLDRPRQTMEMR